MTRASFLTAARCGGILILTVASAALAQGASASRYPTGDGDQGSEGALNGEIVELEMNLQAFTSSEGDGHLGAVAASALQDALDRSTDASEKKLLRSQLRTANATEATAKMLEREGFLLDRRCTDVRDRLAGLDGSPTGSSGARKRAALVPTGKSCVAAMKSWEAKIDRLRPRLDAMVDIIRQH